MKVAKLANLIFAALKSEKLMTERKKQITAAFQIKPCKNF